MSAVHSHMQAGVSNTQFPFSDPARENKLLQGRPDTQRAMNPPHLGGSMPAQGNMLNLYGSGQQQQPQQQQFSQQINPQQQQPQPQGAHPTLGIMPSQQGLVANSGGQPAIQHQTQQHQGQLHHTHQQQRAIMQQRALAANPGLMVNPPSQMQPGMFPPGVNHQMRRISSQPPHQPGGAQMNMGMQAPQQNQPGVSMIPQSIVGQLRQGGPNARMLANHGPPHHHDMAQVMALGRQPHPQTMVNGMQPGQLPRTASGAQMVGPPHQMPMQQQHPQQQQQPQHRTPFQPQGPLAPHQSHAASSPTRPPSHHSQSGTPTANPMSSGTSGQPTMRTQHTSPDNMFMNLQQQQSQNMFPAPNNQHPSQRAPGGGPTFPFLPETSSAGHHPESVNQHPAGAPNPAAPSQPRQPQQQQPPFHITPAQTLQQLQQGGQEPFTHSMMAHNGNPHHPHRVPSSQNATPLSVPGSSRPEAPPQAGPSRTPRPPSRHPNQPPTRGPPPQAPPHVQPILPATSPHHRRASAGLPTQPPPSAPVTQHEGPQAQPPIPRPMLPMNNVIGSGQGLMRLLGFSAALANEQGDRLKYDHWNKIITEFFHHHAYMKLTLWKDNDRREAKPFEIGPNVIAMLFLVSCQAGVLSMNFVLDGARERAIGPSTAFIECADAQWIWRFCDGHVIILRGAFSCQVSAFQSVHATSDQSPPYTLKIETISFDSTSHDRLITLGSIQGTRGVENVQKTPSTTTQGSPDNASSSGGSVSNTKPDDAADRLLEPDPRIMIDHALLPPEPINSFGIPQAAMRCLELAESVGQMTDLFQFGWSHSLGPNEALAKMGVMIRQQMGMGNDRAPAMLQGESKAVSLFGNNSTIADRPTPGPHPPPPPPPVQPPGPGPVQAGSSPQQRPQNQLPPPAAKSGSSSAGVSAPSGPSLKRKAQQPPDGPGVDAQPPSKRTSRRKSKAGGG
ncbi:LIM-domain binding protein-domain-containing protein [Gautieria morchelliformis]|nr:LIM-domain binding protein-domain-containing protein [Gautieria morchelliformis]